MKTSRISYFSHFYGNAYKNAYFLVWNSTHENEHNFLYKKIFLSRIHEKKLLIIRINLTKTNKYINST